MISGSWGPGVCVPESKGSAEEKRATEQEEAKEKMSKGIAMGRGRGAQVKIEMGAAG